MIEATRAARAVLEIDLGAVRHNARQLVDHASGAAVMAVVKGDAYGLGALPVVRALKQEGVRAFAVDNVAEGLELRQAGVDDPILIIDGDIADNAAAAVVAGLMPGIPSEALAAAYERAAAERNVSLPVWLVANVGFNRSGYRDTHAFARFVAQVAAQPHLRIDAVYAHLTNSNGDRDLSLQQIDEFARLATVATQTLGRRVATSLFASHGMLRFCAATPTDWVRPGLLLYGEHGYLPALVEPDTLEAVARYRPAIRLRARVTHRMEFASAQAIGYGQQHHVAAGSALATVTLGFASGFPPGARDLSALVHGRRVHLRGAVGMDALQIDVSTLPEVRAGDWVTFIGSDGGEHIRAAELATLAGLSPYELLSRLDLPRHYHEGT
jgi:alanine racemase